MAAAQTIGIPTDAARFELPHVDGADRVPQRLTAEDEGELRWYLDDPVVAGIGKSGGFGGQLERAECFGYGALPCRKCGGAWRMRRRKRDGTEIVIGWRDGTGRRPKKHFGRQETYAGALARYRRAMVREHRIVIVSHHPDDPGIKAAVREAFDARNEHPLTEAELRDLFPALPDEWTVECNACGGLGVAPRRLPSHAEVTVWPMGSSKRTGARVAVGTDEIFASAVSAGSSAVSDGYAGVSLGKIERYLDVDRILRDVAALSVVARVALEEYYGPAQVQTPGLARGIKLDRRPTAFEALWPLTSFGAGKVPAEFVGRRAAEAEQLYSHACACWQIAAYGAGA